MSTDTDESTRVLRYAFAQGPGRSAMPGPQPGTTAAVAEPVPRGTGAGDPLPTGTTELLEQAPYPSGRVGTGSLEHTLVAGLGLQRAELCNPYFEHRSLASVRSLYPVNAFLTGGGRTRVFDAYRHRLADLGAGPDARRILLAGHFTRLPAFYGRLRGTLVELELGITLRALAVALELFGVPARLRLPTDGSELGLTPTYEWSWPITVEPGPAPAEEPAPDPLLAEVVAVNRAQGSSSLGPAVPARLSESTQSWADVLWQRTSGRMPRRLTGMIGRRRQLSGIVLADAAAWLGVPPPGPLAEVAQAVRITAVVQNTDGYADGIYHGGGLDLGKEAPGLLGRLETHYAYRSAPGNGCDVRHACAVWFLTASQRELVARFGPRGWTQAQYLAGWYSHALSLNAAAHQLYARPARAFDSNEVPPLLGLPADETVLLSVITGTPRYTELPLDLRL